MAYRTYNNLEPILQYILSNHISLQDDEIKENNKILKEILLLIKEYLKKNTLFRNLFSDIFYGGSYYDGLRVGHPNEFDIDLLLRLPKELGAYIEKSEINGFVCIKINNLVNFKKQQHLMDRYGELLKYIDELNFLMVNKILNWFESIVTTCLSSLFLNGYYIFNTYLGTFKAKVHKSGPASTLKIYDYQSEHLMDVDLVPCFVFTKDKLPTGFRTYSLPNRIVEEFFVVPKPLINDRRKWRLSFQQQERVLIDNKLNLKPSLKLMKQMRDVLDHKQIASYYLKTLFIRLASTKEESYWKNSISFVFMESLKYYRDQLLKGKIEYFWDDQYNLLSNINQSHLTGIGNQMDGIIRNIEKNLADNPEIIKKYLIKSSIGGIVNEQVHNDERSICNIL